MQLRTVLIVSVSLLLSPRNALAWNQIEILTLEIDSVTIDGHLVADLSDYPESPPAQLFGFPGGRFDAVALEIARNATPCLDGVVFGCGSSIPFEEIYDLERDMDGGAP